MFVKIWVPSVCSNESSVFLLVLFRAGGKTPDPKLQVRSYMDVMREQHLTKEEVRSILFTFLWTLDCIIPRIFPIAVTSDTSDSCET